VEPMLASPMDVLPEGASWVFELNWDGCCGLAAGKASGG
jgi:hypothetical protein